MSRLILASQSPRRKELLKTIVSDFECIPAKGDEVFHSGPIDEAQRDVALAKAREVFQAHPESIVLAADTIVVDGSRILQKPKSKAEAFETLRSLSGRSHEVKTAVVLMEEKQTISTVETTVVHFRNLSDKEIQAYVEQGTCLDKAGSYGIQDVDFVDGIDGSYTTVVGLPVELVRNWLESRSLADVPQTNAQA